MGIREKLNDNPAITTGITAAIIVIALIVIVWQLVSSNRGPTIPTQNWYTSDDGATYVADDIKLIPPFEKDGKTWVRAVVFKCKDGKPFVSHLERYTPKAKAALEDSRAKAEKGEMVSPDFDQVQMTGLEVKKPGTPDNAWVNSMNYEKAAEITRVTCPDGTTEGLEPVMP